MTVNLDWENLGFSYMKLPYRYIAHYRNGSLLTLLFFFHGMSTSVSI